VVTILLPDLSTTFLAALIVPLILGFLVGIVARGLLKVGLAIALLVFILIGIGTITPSQVIGPIVSMFRSGSAYTTKVSQISGYLPYSSVTFLLGLVLGFYKG
jgi:predicted metal-binding membrane protein